MKTSILAIIGGVIAVAIVSVFVYDGIMLDKICQDDGGKRIGDTCQIPIMANYTSSQTPNPVSIKVMKPNSAEFFYYPNPAYTKDAYRWFMLIRLPEWLGGNANDTSAFRAYSAKALDDPCIVKYWPQQGRQRIENPCQGGMYRVIDGMLTHGSTPRYVAMTVLPHLDLSMDENGLLYVEPPKWTKTDNGVIGYGREMTMDEILDSSKFLADSFAKSFPFYPKIPVEFAGFQLSEIYPDVSDTTISYVDFQNKIGYLEMSIKNHPSGINYTNFSASNFEFWQMGDTVMRIDFSQINNSDRPEQFRNYVIDFKKGNFNFTISGQNLEFIKKEIVRNFFPENSYDEMFLVSSTVK